MKRFLNHVGETSCDAITRTQAKQHLEQQAVALQAKRALSAFFSWCKDTGREYVAENSIRKLRLSISRKDSSGIPVLSVGNAASFFSEIPDDMRAGFALMAFASVRPMEIVADKKRKDVLMWDAIDFDRRVISIPGGVAKTREPRTLHDLPGTFGHGFL